MLTKLDGVCAVVPVQPGVPCRSKAGFVCFAGLRAKSLISKAHRGFTLVEAMIVVAIIGILASVAIPIYADYSTRTKMSEAILAASVCRTSITKVYQRGLTAPGAGNWGCESNISTYVSAITTDDDGVVTVTVTNASPAVNGLKIQMVPYISGVPANIASNRGDDIKEWRCGPATTGGVDRKFLPASCRF